MRTGVKKKSAARAGVSGGDILLAAVEMNRAMKLDRRPDGGAIAEIPVRRPRFLVPPLSWILPFSTIRRVQLDNLGLEVLDLCNGNRTIESVIENFAAAHKLTFREAQVSVMQFLRMLADRGIVAIVGPDAKVEE
ncbi:MAG: PqqD family protein [Planctomycetes bacterium]|nr:PqqD family protein [Planctomycetota bacterium]